MMKIDQRMLAFPVPAGPRKPGAYLLMGIPDDGSATAEYRGWDQQPALVVGGTATFLTHVDELPWALRSIHFGAPSLEFKEVMKAWPSINFMADADMHSRALRQAGKFVQALRTPCFNAPAAVALTTRDGVAQRLADIPGLQVPVTVRAKADTLAQLRQAMGDAGLVCPVLVRMPGSHSGASTALVRDDTDWDAINPLPWGGRDVYLTQYVDYADEDGLYRKMRLAVVGEQVLVKHRYASRDWMIHSKARLPGTDNEEQAFLDAFDRETLPLIEPTLLEVTARLGLDYFGLDVSLRPDGRLLLFEANASMTMLDDHSERGPMWQAPTRRIRLALQALLAEPARWRLDVT